MIQTNTINGLAERLVMIDGFSAYSISDWGRVYNNLTSRFISTTRNTRGIAIVGMMPDEEGRKQAKRSVAVLVANAFLPPMDNPHFDTPINLDGDRMNNHHGNLTWRPLWFAQKYHHQFIKPRISFDRPIEDVETGERYENSWHAATANGLLDAEIYISMCGNTYVWPTGQIFREVV